MAGFDVYVFVVCMIVFVLLTASFGCGITHITKLTVKLIRTGAEDKKIKTEYDKYVKNHKGNCALSCVDRVVSLCLFVIVLAAFIFALTTNIKGNEKVGETPVLQVVQSGSMSYKSEYNEKVYGKDEIDNQIQVFDLIWVHQLPAEQDLQLYDIVVYELEGSLVAHRIVGIEEPNEKHSERHFLLQGDAVANPDRFPVKYEQMVGIYRNQRIPFVGSLIMFLKSPAGFVCILLVIFGVFITPIGEKRIWKIKLERLIEICYIALEEAKLGKPSSKMQPAEAGVTQSASAPRRSVASIWDGKTVVNIRVDKQVISIKQDSKTGKLSVEQTKGKGKTKTK